MLQPPGSPSPWHREQAKGRSVGSQGCFRPRPCAPHWSESHAACALTIPLAQGGPWEREGEASFPLQDQNNPTHQHHGPPAPASSHVTDSSFWRASGVWKEWLLSLTLPCHPLSGRSNPTPSTQRRVGYLCLPTPCCAGSLGPGPAVLGAAEAGGG